MNLLKYQCRDCAFCRQGKRIVGYNRKSGKYETASTLLCTMNPPASHYGNPETSEAMICAFFTDANGKQPLRRFYKGEAAV